MHAFSASPCSVVMRFTARPIAQIASSPTYTPRCSLRGCARDAEAEQRADDGVLDRGDQRDDLAKALEPADRVDDDLARAVIRHVAAALDLDDVDAARREQRAREQNVAFLGVAARA